jgi:hypothetical protein
MMMLYVRSDALAEREVNKNSDKKTKSDDALLSRQAT